MAFDISEIAGSGTRTLQQLDAIAHNLANVSTSGFKAEHLYYAMNKIKGQQKENNNPASTSTMPSLQPTKVIDFSQGILEKTGNNLDVAIEGEGFFAIQQDTGTTYTRNGSFVINKNKELVMKTGAKVIGESGAIKIDGTSIDISSDGSVLVDGKIVGKLKIVAFKSPSDLTRATEGQFIDEGNAGLKKAENYRVAGGSLELSNVNAIKEMIDMIELQRSGSETYSKIIQTIADFDKISTNRIGKLI